MGCGSCGSGGCGIKKKSASGVAGCQSNGTCGTGGCNKMNVFDWLGNMDLPDPQRYNIVEVRFKGGRKEYFRNPDLVDLCTGDAVVVDAGNGYHIGEVTLQGELVRLQILKKKVKDDEIKVIYRTAGDKDLEKFEEVKNRELTTLYRTRQIVEELKLTMKMSDVEYQADNTKATFYYSAEERVDFRELIKLLASEFKIRVEMRQISLRQEAGRLGGIGSCGRELCCSTWLTDFKSVSTAAARYQNLSLNPSKLSGQCGRLKCCLNYELETYLDALVDIPKVEKPLLTVQGEAHLQKTDIFKKIMWFSYDTESTWYPISTEKVKEIQSLNEQGKPAESLSMDENPKTAEKPANPNQNVQLDDKEKDRINTRKSSKSKRNKKKNRKPENGTENRTEGKQEGNAENLNEGKQENRRDNRNEGNTENRNEGKQENRREHRRENRNENRNEGNTENRNEGKQENRRENRNDNRNEGNTENRNEGKQENRRENRNDNRNEGNTENRNEGKQENRHENRRGHKNEGNAENRNEVKQENRNEKRHEHRNRHRQSNRPERKDKPEKVNPDKVNPEKINPVKE